MDPTLLILDVREKETTEPKAPSFPQIKPTTSGFPEPKKRTRLSAFKQKRQGQGVLSEQEKSQVFLSSTNEPLTTASPGAQAASSNKTSQSSEKQRIDRENTERLATMSPQEIETARQELFNGMDPSILEMLLKRANLDEGANSSPFDHPPSTSQDADNTQQPPRSPPEIRIQDTSIQQKSTVPGENKETDSHQKPGASTTIKHVPPPTVTDEADEADEPETKTNASRIDDAAPTAPPEEYIINKESDTSKPHWPQPRQPADLDPNDPDFLQHLHEKYFPNLPADPSKLAWMAPVPTPNSPADQDSPYYPGQDSLSVSALRFDFRGMLLPPRISRAVPVSKGLHHHGEAPEAAGYTVRELARLQRSAVPGQRCVAYQTLGRILYRLGRGQFGGPGDDMAVGIWRQIEEGAVMRSLYDEAGTEEGRGHRSARAFATEAIWLFEKGGWKERLRKAK